MLLLFIFRRITFFSLFTSDIYKRSSLLFWMIVVKKQTEWLCKCEDWLLHRNFQLSKSIVAVDLRSWEKNKALFLKLFCSKRFFFIFMWSVITYQEEFYSAVNKMSVWWKDLILYFQSTIWNNFSHNCHLLFNLPENMFSKAFLKY